MSDAVSELSFTTEFQVKPAGRTGVIAGWLTDHLGIAPC